MSNFSPLPPKKKACTSLLAGCSAHILFQMSTYPFSGHLRERENIKPAQNLETYQESFPLRANTQTTGFKFNLMLKCFLKLKAHLANSTEFEVLQH